jgi:predicted PurR-regulated permease PerM
LFFAVRDSFSTFSTNASTYISGAITAVQSWTQTLCDFFPVEFRQQADQVVLDIGNSFWATLKNNATSDLTAIPSTLGLFLGFAALPIFSFFLLRDWDKLRSGLYLNVPGWASRDFKSIMSIVGTVLGQYIRAVLVLGLVVGTLT